MSKTYLVIPDLTTSKVRSILCHNCNRALGLIKDRADVAQRMVTYLNE